MTSVPARSFDRHRSRAVFDGQLGQALIPDFLEACLEQFALLPLDISQRPDVLDNFGAHPFAGDIDVGRAPEDLATGRDLNRGSPLAPGRVEIPDLRLIRTRLPPRRRYAKEKAENREQKTEVRLLSSVFRHLSSDFCLLTSVFYLLSSHKHNYT